MDTLLRAIVCVVLVVAWAYVSSYFALLAGLSIGTTIGILGGFVIGAIGMVWVMGDL